MLMQSEAFLMAVKKELVIVIPNRPGTLGNITTELGRAGINLLGVDAASGIEYNVVRLVPDDAEKARRILRKKGQEIAESDVLVVTTKDQPGALAKVTSALGRAGVNIDYLYATAGKSTGEATIIIHVEDAEAAQKLVGKL
jgi:hypothetical protein